MTQDELKEILLGNIKRDLAYIKWKRKYYGNFYAIKIEEEDK